jgi:hypothetical protein
LRANQSSGAIQALASLAHTSVPARPGQVHSGDHMLCTRRQAGAWPRRFRVSSAGRGGRGDRDTVVSVGSIEELDDRGRECREIGESPNYSLSLGDRVLEGDKRRELHPIGRRVFAIRLRTTFLSETLSARINPVATGLKYRSMPGPSTEKRSGSAITVSRRRCFRMMSSWCKDHRSSFPPW